MLHDMRYTGGAKMTEFIERPRTACALAGALSAIGNLPGVIPIIHSPLGCGGNLANSVAFGAGYLGGGYCSGGAAPSTGVTETEIVFGGTDRLGEQIKNTLELIDGELYVVATGCMTEMIGDDAAGIVSGFRDDGNPILAISTPSFKGDSYHGYGIVLDGIFNRYLPKAEKKNPRLVNLFGLVPGYDPFFRGDLEEIARLLSALGLEANTFFTPGQTFDNLASAPSAALNIVLSRVWGTELAERFEERHGTPYIVADLPIGPEATDGFLRAVSQRLGLGASKGAGGGTGAGVGSSAGAVTGDGSGGGAGVGVSAGVGGCTGTGTGAGSGTDVGAGVGSDVGAGAGTGSDADIGGGAGTGTGADTDVETVIAEENRRFYGYFERAADAFCDGDLKFYAVTVTNANYAIPLSRFVTRELGWVVVDSFVTDKLSDLQKSALSAGGGHTFQYVAGAREIAAAINNNHPNSRGQRYFDDITPLYIIGSTLEKRTAAARGAKHLSVSFPAYDRLIADRGYAGYRGGLHLFEDLVGQIMSAKS
jgi:nitrogenase molybdenum-iron protein alpha/beta subunit